MYILHVNFLLWHEVLLLARGIPQNWIYRIMNNSGHSVEYLRYERNFPFSRNIIAYFDSKLFWKWVSVDSRDHQIAPSSGIGFWWILRMNQTRLDTALAHSEGPLPELGAIWWSQVFTKAQFQNNFKWEYLSIFWDILNTLRYSSFNQILRIELDFGG